MGSRSAVDLEMDCFMGAGSIEPTHLTPIGVCYTQLPPLAAGQSTTRTEASSGVVPAEYLASGAKTVTGYRSLESRLDTNPPFR